MINNNFRLDANDFFGRVNLDNSQTMFFARELEQILATKYNVLQQPLSLFTLMPTETVAEWVDVVTYDQYEKQGLAKIIAGSGDDIPLVNVGGKQLSTNVRELGLGYTMSISELRAAAAKQKPIETYKIEAVQRGHYEQMNKLGFYGDARHGLTGWLGTEGIDKKPVVGGDADERIWDFKKAQPQLILDDLNEAVKHVSVSSNTVHKVNTIAMTVNGYHIISETRMAAGTDTTVKEFFLSNNPGVQIFPVPELEKAFPGQTDGFIAYEVLGGYVAAIVGLEPTPIAAQWKDFDYVVNYRSRFGGVVVRYPKSQCFRYGI